MTTPISNSQNSIAFLIGLDIGSTTVKGIVCSADDQAILWHDYRRHDTRQAEMVLDFLHRMEAEIGIIAGNCRIFLTGSGANALSILLGARFVQEVNAVALAVEKLHPEVHSVIELGGQDAKFILFQQGTQGQRHRFTSMNDKCAGGTGAVIDRIQAKLKIPAEQLPLLSYLDARVHPVAGKCGVFAETDINSLQKQGLPPEELMASLYEAIVQQNLAVLTRGNTLLPYVVLLGGPNAFLRGLREAWQQNIVRLWQDRKIKLPLGKTAEELIFTPENALYYAAIGAIEFGLSEEGNTGLYTGYALLEASLAEDGQNRQLNARPGLCQSTQDLQRFLLEFQQHSFRTTAVREGENIEAFLGIDGGSTSTKAVLVSPNGKLLHKAYQLSQGNPITDTVEVLRLLRQAFTEANASLHILGAGVTGYAKEIIQQALQADVALVETIAHTQSALHYSDEPEVIVDVGGQDIKIILLRNGQVRDFRLNTQCSAGNGYFLQSTAEGLGIAVEQYAPSAFSARSTPPFGYGCAVFLQSDIVNFQRQGWKTEEILAGLAQVLPRNVFLHVAKAPDLQRLGTRFLLQGGTQKNPAVVKAFVDYIREGFHGTGIDPQISVHPHCGEAGAIGVALEAIRLQASGHATTFIGLDAVDQIRLNTHSNEDDRCHLCKNSCMRTLLEVSYSNSDDPRHSLPPLQPKRIILAGCERGTAHSNDDLQKLQKQHKQMLTMAPNLVDIAARTVWKPRHPASIESSGHCFSLARSARKNKRLSENRKNIRIGIPRVLSMYTYAPLFSAYLESLGVLSENIVYSDFTHTDLVRTGTSRGSIDPCFPSKIAAAHVHNLLFHHHAKNSLDIIFFPMFDVLTSPLRETRASNGCPTASITPETVKAAFTKECNLFAEQGINYLHPIINLSHRRLFERQMFQTWAPILGISSNENQTAISVAFQEQKNYENEIRIQARTVLNQLESENRIGIVMLGRAYQHDPGINHQIMQEFQMLGYPVFSQSTLPMDHDLLERLFGEEIRNGLIEDPMSVNDVWKTSSSAGSNLKLWAARFTARHPNLVALEFSNFKCGHDAPIYHVIEQIIEASGTPYFSFKDMDENRPTHSIRMRVETIAYFLDRYQRMLKYGATAFFE